MLLNHYPSLFMSDTSLQTPSRYEKRQYSTPEMIKKSRPYCWLHRCWRRLQESFDARGDRYLHRCWKHWHPIPGGSHLPLA
jgi:hypothetical protein